MSIQEYVLGFAFGNIHLPGGRDVPGVALIEKARPNWQAGRLNGIGGHIEDYDSSPKFAMTREFEEETGLATSVGWWHLFARMESPGVGEPRLHPDGGDWRVWCYRANAVDLEALETKTDEQIMVVPVQAIFAQGLLPTLENIPWLVALALDERARTYRVIT